MSPASLTSGPVIGASEAPKSTVFALICRWPPLEPMPAPEELALAVEIESEEDFEVIEMLDWLETLGEIESS
mgnify:CR=1 FL=1